MAPAKKPYRLYRYGVYVLYGLLVGVPAMLFLSSIVRALSDRPEAATTPRVAQGEALNDDDYLVCLTALQDQHRALSDRFYSVGALAGQHGSAGLRTWQTFSRQWSSKVESIVTQCRLDDLAQGDTRGEQLAGLLEGMEELHRVYGNQATRLLREDGDTVREVQNSFRKAKLGGS